MRHEIFLKGQMRKEDTKTNLEAKWGEGGLSLGWTPVPTSLMFLQAELGMTSTDLNVILNLIMHWWDVKDKIYPSQDAIAYRMGVSKRTVQRTLDRLVELELIEVKHTKRNGKYRGRNIYSMTPLTRKLELMSPIVKETMMASKGLNSENDE